MSGPLSSWHEGAAKTDIVHFVDRACGRGGSEAVPVAERVAVFDNDGTLWCEKPVPIQADFLLRRLAEMAEADPDLRSRQPWKSAHEGDFAWLGATMNEHYAGDYTNVRTLAAGILSAFGNISVDHFAALSEVFLRSARHPTLGIGYLECAYAPMLDLLAYLEANDFTSYIASGGGRDFMRTVSHELYGIPSERVIGSAVALAYTPDEHGGTITHARKHLTIWTTGRRNRCTSGCERAVARCLPRATPTGTSRCSTSASTRTSRSCVCSFFTTTRRASEPKRAGRCGGSSGACLKEPCVQTDTSTKEMTK